MTDGPCVSACHIASAVRESAWLQKPRTFVSFSQCQCMQSLPMQKNPRYRMLRAYQGKKYHMSRHLVQSRHVQFDFWLTFRTHTRILASACGTMVFPLRHAYFMGAVAASVNEAGRDRQAARVARRGRSGPLPESLNPVSNEQPAARFHARLRCHNATPIPDCPRGHVLRGGRCE